MAGVQGRTRSTSYAQVAIWARLRAPMVVMRLARWNLTVLRLVWG